MPHKYLRALSLMVHLLCRVPLDIGGPTLHERAEAVPMLARSFAIFLVVNLGVYL